MASPAATRAPSIARGLPLGTPVPPSAAAHDGSRAGSGHVHRRERVYARLVRLLLDTNVLVAALVARGTCSDLLQHGVRQHVVISSQALLDELRDGPSGSSGSGPSMCGALFDCLPGRSRSFRQAPSNSPTCRDRDDDVVLATALAGACDAILTGDQDLLVLDPFHAIRILAPSGFWKRELARDDR